MTREARRRLLTTLLTEAMKLAYEESHEKDATEYYRNDFGYGIYGKIGDIISAVEQIYDYAGISEKETETETGDAMKKFNVEIQKAFYYTAEIEIEAENENEARRIAECGDFDEDDEDIFISGWHDADSDGYEVLNIDEVESEEVKELKE